MSAATVVQPTNLLKIQQVAVDLWKADQKAFSASEKSAKGLGAALLEVKAVMPYGKYTRWLAENSIDRNRANYCVRVATGQQAAKAEKKHEPNQVFEELTRLLNALVPSVTDGVEHKTVTLLEEAAKRFAAKRLTKEEEQRRASRLWIY